MSDIVVEWDNGRPLIVQDSGSPSSLSHCDCSLAPAGLIGLEAWIKQACFRLDHQRMIN